MVMFRGSIIGLVSALEYHFNRVTAAEKMAAMESIVREEINSAVNGLRQTAIDILSNPA